MGSAAGADFAAKLVTSSQELAKIALILPNVTDEFLYKKMGSVRERSPET